MYDLSKLADFFVEHLPSTDSTNSYAKMRAREGAGHMTLILAEEQTQGRGRLGRDWLSAPEGDITMSLILRPENLPPKDAPTLVFPIAVAMAESIRKHTGLDVRIKWPNDLVACGKKISGMLLETGMSADGIDYIVAGIGVNVLGNPNPALPYAATLSSLTGKALSREMLIRGFLSRFFALYASWLEGGISAVLPDYLALSATVGSCVRAILPDGELIGIAAEIDRDGALVVVDKEQKKHILHAGDVSVRGVMGYV